MTSKKRRQRGSRTHGGGTHKNRRGAGHRGGRGAAGRDKHEFHNYPERKKHGFKRPQGVDRDVREIDVRRLDEDLPLLLEDGLAESVDGGYRLDARDVVDGHDADAVKVLGTGQVRNELTVVADAFTDGARTRLEGAGGAAVLSERAQADADGDEDDDEADDSATTTDADDVA